MSENDGSTFAAPWKQKASPQKPSSNKPQGKGVKEILHVKVTLPLKTGQKTSKRNLKNEPSAVLQQPERSNSDSLPESSTSGNEYRALRRKYLLLEEESFGLGTEMREVEEEVKTLEDEKLALLDELVVLEGLVDPSELQPKG